MVYYIKVRETPPPDYEEAEAYDQDRIKDEMAKACLSHLIQEGYEAEVIYYPNPYGKREYNITSDLSVVNKLCQEGWIAFTCVTNERDRIKFVLVRNIPDA